MRRGRRARDDVAGVFAFPIAKQFAYAGTTHLAIGHIDLARGHMLLGDIGGTEAMLGFVLDASPERLSASIVRRLVDLGRELGGQQYGGVTQATQLRERLQYTAVLAATPAALPSEPST